MFDDIVKKGTEGLMLHRADSLYHSARSDDLLKLKPRQDAEATVIEILPGKGKFSGMMGALVKRTKAVTFSASDPVSVTTRGGILPCLVQ